MAGYSIYAELRDVRKALQDLYSGAQSATINSPSGSHSYTKLTIDQLTAREIVLLGRISRSNTRKRTAPDFGNVSVGY
jgi:hypothetical protein